MRPLWSIACRNRLLKPWPYTSSTTIALVGAGPHVVAVEFAMPTMSLDNPNFCSPSPLSIQIVVSTISPPTALRSAWMKPSRLNSPRRPTLVNSPPRLAPTPRPFLARI